VFVDVADTLELKIRAMAEYESESRRFPHPRSAEALRALATHRGSAVGVAAAEAFEVVRELR
jgi:LmbE family N-acetylglucosaminyl deacetylase